MLMIKISFMYDVLPLDKNEKSLATTEKRAVIVVSKYSEYQIGATMNLFTQEDDFCNSFV